MNTSVNFPIFNDYHVLVIQELKRTLMSRPIIIAKACNHTKKDLTEVETHNNRTDHWPFRSPY